MDRRKIETLDLRDKIITEILVYEDCHFIGDVLFQFSTIEKRVRFKNCVFDKDVIFGKKSQSFWSYVGQELCFENCEFIGQVYLDGIQCKGNIMFSDCKFLYESKFDNDYALSIGSAEITNTVIIKNSLMMGGISLADTAIHLVGFILENVKIIAPKCNLYFSTCHINKEFLFKSCIISVKRLFMEKMNVDGDNGNIKLTGTYLNRAIKKNPEEGLDDFARRLFANPKLDLDTNFREVRTIGNYTSVTTNDGNIYALINVNDNLYLIYKSNYVEAEEVITFRSSILGNSVEVIASEIHSKNICFAESICGSMIFECSYFALKQLDLSSINIKGSYSSVNNQYGVEKSDYYKGITLHSANIGNNLNIAESSFFSIEGDGIVSYDMSNIQVGGVLSISKIQGDKQVEFNLENSKCEEFCYSQTGQSRVKLKLEGSQFGNIAMGKDNSMIMPNYNYVLGLLSDKDIEVLSRRDRKKYQHKQNTTIETGIINYLRSCQDQLINKQDDFEEANQIWRLRNKIRILRKSQYKKNFSFYIDRIWNGLTDYGLSSSRLAWTVVIVFFVYCGLNTYVLDSYTQYNVTDNTMNVVGQSLIQYVPTIDFGDEVKIIDFEEGLPSMYKYLVIFARIVGFVLISVLIGSLGGFWTGRNK